MTLRSVFFTYAALSALAFVSAISMGAVGDGSGATGSNQSNEARISELIEQLGADSYHVRVNASWELSRIGLPAFGQLRKATDHSNIQIASSARYIIESQNVTWWLEADSAEVRRLLTNYNRMNEVERDTRMQRLAEVGTEDAILALGRLARFESNEELSKSAALYLMEYVAANDRQPNLARSILVTIGDDRRAATDWLRQLCNEQGGAQADVAAWRAFAETEAKDAARLREVLRGRRPTAEANAEALRLYRWVGLWLTQRNGREQAMEIARQALELVPHDAHGYQEFSKWAIAADLPELVISLAAENSATFQKEPLLGFLLAECHLKVGDKALADQTALQASGLIGQISSNLHIPSSVNVNDLIANRRRAVAMHLIERGLFQWAEHEYAEALSQQTSAMVEAELRNYFADFYWGGGEFQKAADVLRPMHEKQANNVDQGLPGPTTALASVAPMYYFYSGLAAKERKEFDAASEFLEQAMDANLLGAGQDNPDVVIAMKQIADTPERLARFELHFDVMVQEYRRHVITQEQVLAESPERRSRAYIGLELASACNQLAWLLSKCEMHGDEAINLSRRSLEFRPGDPTFLDTYARCHFAAGMFDKAVEYQAQALERSPHDRQMKVQLAEFKAALAAQQK